MGTNNSRCGLDEKQRRKILHDLGFVEARHAAGSHEIMEHLGMRLFAKSSHVQVPPNLGTTAPWSIILCDNPAKGTWLGMLRRAQWCHNMAEQIKDASDHDRRRYEVARQFHDAVKDRRQWMHDVKNALRSGAPLPEAPVPYQQLLNLKAAKNELSTPKS